MEDSETKTSNSLEERISALEQLVGELKQESPRNELTIGVFSGELDKIIAAFIIALGGTAYDMEVNMFFTFWATAALRDPTKSAKKDFFGNMFGWMLPKGSRKMPLSRMNMGGMGPGMIRTRMKRKGVASLEEMIHEAGELGVKIHICEMSMDLMGFKAEEMIDYPGLDYCGVGTFVAMLQESKQCFFL